MRQARRRSCGNAARRRPEKNRRSGSVPGSRNGQRSAAGSGVEQSRTASRRPPCPRDIPRPRRPARAKRRGSRAGRDGLAEIAPHLLPGVIGLGDQRAVARRGAVGAADDAVMVAGRGKRIGDARPLLQQRHAVPGLDQRPGGRQAGNAGANDDDVHVTCQSATIGDQRSRRGTTTTQRWSALSLRSCRRTDAVTAVTPTSFSTLRQRRLLVDLFHPHPLTNAQQGQKPAGKSIRTLISFVAHVAVRLQRTASPWRKVNAWGLKFRSSGHASVSGLPPRGWASRGSGKGRRALDDPLDGAMANAMLAVFDGMTLELCATRCLATMIANSRVAPRRLSGGECCLPFADPASLA